MTVVDMDDIDMGSIRVSDDEFISQFWANS